MGFETLKFALDEGQALAPFTVQDVPMPEKEISDESALKLVVQDVNLANAYLDTKTLRNDWNLCDDLVRAFVAPEAWPNSNNARANLSMPVVLEAIETNLLPEAHMAFFSDAQPFILDPVGTTTVAVARVLGKLGKWALKQADFEEQIRLMLKSAYTYGTCVGKYGWETKTVHKISFGKANGKVVPLKDSKDIQIPTFEQVDLRNILVDPMLRSQDIRKARFVIHQTFIAANELDSLRDAGFQNVPTDEELARILTEQSETTKDSLRNQAYATWRENQALPATQKNSANPMQQPLEILEYWTDDRVITVLQRCIVLRNEVNEFHEKPFRSCCFIDVLNSFYGFGVGKLLEGEQRFQTGVANAWVDSLSLIMNPMFHRKKGIGAGNQNILAAPGRVVNDDGDLVPMPIQSITKEALDALQSSEARSNRRVGSNYGNEMPTQAMRTAEGVQAFTSGIQVRLQYFINQFANLVFTSVVEKFLELCKANLQPDEIKLILSENDQQVYEGDILDVYNGQYTVDVLSSTKLAGRRGMASILPLIIQMTQAQPVQQSLVVQNRKFNYTTLMQQALDVVGWPGADQLFEEMTPEDQQRAQQQNDAYVRAQGMAQLQAQKHQDDLQLEEAKGYTRSGVQVVKHALDSQGAEHEAALALQQTPAPVKP